MASVRERIDAARDRLVQAGLQPADAAIDAAVLARHVLGWDRAALLTHGREIAPPSFVTQFDEFVARRAAREPVAMITGVREFWGLAFEVTRDVLIPRPETELIVEEALTASGDTPRRIVDVGTGSGCLAIALGCEFPHARVVGTDISPAALAVARRNAERHGVTSRVSFVRTNFLGGIGHDVDLIVSNPPYVPEAAAAGLSPEVVRHEPHTALFSGGDGLGAIREILRDSAGHLSPPGRLILEFGYGQEDEVTTMAAGEGWRVINVREDLQGIPRVVVLGRHA